MALGTAAEALVSRMKGAGIRYVFGYPGGQLTPLYDALYREPAIRHLLARDEQAAAFMADGYARATGKPGVCLAVCGPGVLNAATPLAEAFTDSVPVLLISGQVPRAGNGLRSGYYHENDQMAACLTLTKSCIRVEDSREVVPSFDHAFRILTEGRPGPVLLEIPADVLRETIPREQSLSPVTERFPPSPSKEEVSSIARCINEWKRPLIMAGGGVIASGGESQLIQLADRLGAPVFTSLMGKCAFPSDHFLAAGVPWDRATSDLTNMGDFFSPLFKEADGLLAIGCRFSQVSTGSWTLPMPPSLIHVDIDPKEIGRHYPVTLGLNGDASQTVRSLLAALPTSPRRPWAHVDPKVDTWRLPGIDFVGSLRRALPRDAIVSADITRLAYIMLTDFPTYLPRTFLHPAGFVAMGFGIPAALGAQAAFPEKVVVAVVGDGCFMMSGMELATAVQEKLPVITIVINDSSLSLIKAIQERKYERRYLGVDLINPDFPMFAASFGIQSWKVRSDEELEKSLKVAIERRAPALIEVEIREPKK